jgi:hypothetical protein
MRRFGLQGLVSILDPDPRHPNHEAAGPAAPCSAVASNADRMSCSACQTGPGVSYTTRDRSGESSGHAAPTLSGRGQVLRRRPAALAGEPHWVRRQQLPRPRLGRHSHPALRAVRALPACKPVDSRGVAGASRPLTSEMRLLWLAAKQEPSVLFCMPDRTDCILLVSVMSACLSTHPRPAVSHDNTDGRATDCLTD